MKVVLDTKPESAYDDDVATRYHFPSRYLGLLKQAIGDWAMFRRPRAGGEGISYFAVGGLTAITPDPSIPGHHYAAVANFLPFDRPVEWRTNGRYAEAALRAITNVPQVGLYLRGKSVRPLEDEDFAAIVAGGLADTLDPANAARLGLEREDADAAAAALSAVGHEFERRIATVLTNRAIRDASFRRAVCAAYRDQCAVSGLRIVNGGGRSEVQAAHILPVALGGPDIVQNGIALSATAHWLFDRHLISVGEDYRLLFSHNKVPAQLQELYGRQAERIILPNDRRLWPSQHFLSLHRERFASA